MSKEIDFLDKNTFKAVELLMNGQLYLREIAEKANIAASMAFKTMKKLEERGIVKSKKAKNKRFFELNKENPLAREAITLIFSHKVLQSKAFKAIKAMKPKAIYLFGSGARGDVDALSDLDVAVISNELLPKEKIFAAKNSLEKETRKEVQLLILTKEKMQKLRKENQELFNEIAFGGILLWGEEIGGD